MKPVAPTLFGVAVLVAALPARADFETWIWAEARVPVITAPTPAFPRLDWRVFTDARMNVRSGGLSQLFFRTGPLLYVTSWMFIGLHGTVYADRLGKPAGDLEAGDFDQEARVELEPNLFWRLGDFTFNDRNRLEYRWREYETRYRYRNQLRVNYAPRGAAWIPFVWDELLVDLSGKGVNQNRFNVGLGRMVNAHTRLDVATTRPGLTCGTQATQAGTQAATRVDMSIWVRSGFVYRCGTVSFGQAEPPAAFPRAASCALRVA